MSRRAAVQIVERLREHGHVAYLAGGCVRDRLLGLEPKDHDVATDAPPEAVLKLFRRSQAVGEAFGVVLVYVGHGAERAGVEVATFRTEGVYSDGRRPDDVSYSDARHDAQRRDFTVNGLFEDPLHKRQPNPVADDDGVIDYVGGRADLDAGVLRAIGDPARRFAEDYLRMLRAVRFAARLGFELHADTAAAIRDHAGSLERIARERIGDEVRRAIAGPRPHLAASLLQGLSLDGPTLTEPPADPPLGALERLAPGAGYPAALAAWMFDRAASKGGPPQPADVARYRQALRLSNDETDALGRILRHIRSADDWPGLGVAGRKRLLSCADWDAALAVLRALGRAQAIEADTPALRDDNVGLAPPPLLDGGDLIASGLPPGPRFKTLLDRAYDAQLEGRLTSREEALAWVKEAAATG